MRNYFLKFVFENQLKLQKNAYGIASTTAKNHIGQECATLYARNPKGFGKYYGNKKETTSQSHNDDDKKSNQNDEENSNFKPFLTRTADV